MLDLLFLITTTSSVLDHGQVDQNARWSLALFRIVSRMEVKHTTKDSLLDVTCLAIIVWHGLSVDVLALS